MDHLTDAVAHLTDVVEHMGDEMEESSQHDHRHRHRHHHHHHHHHRHGDSFHDDSSTPINGRVDYQNAGHRNGSFIEENNGFGGDLEKSFYYDSKQGLAVPSSPPEKHGSFENLDMQKVLSAVMKEMDNLNDDGLSSSSATSPERLRGHEHAKPEPSTRRWAEHTRGDLIEESDEEVIELEFESAAKMVHSHNMYCPNCNSCITKVVLRRKRVSRTPPAAPSRPEEQVDLLGCLSCFSFFIPLGNRLNPFKLFSRRRAEERAQIHEQPPAARAKSFYPVVAYDNETFVDVQDDDFNPYMVFCNRRKVESTQKVHEQPGAPEIYRRPQVRESRHTAPTFLPTDKARTQADLNDIYRRPQVKEIRYTAPTFVPTDKARTQADLNGIDRRPHVKENIAAPHFSHKNQEPVPASGPDDLDDLLPAPTIKDGFAVSTATEPLITGKHVEHPSPERYPSPPDVILDVEDELGVDETLVKEDSHFSRKSQEPVPADLDGLLPAPTIRDGFAIGTTTDPLITGKPLEPSSRERYRRPIDVILDVEDQPGDAGLAQDAERTGVIQTPGLIEAISRFSSESQSSNSLEILKSIVYGGLMELITSFSVVASAAATDVTTLNIIALGLANMFGGLLITIENIRKLKKDNNLREASIRATGLTDQYQVLLGRRENYILHVVFVVLSFLLFGLVPPVTYGFSFYKSGDRDMKLLAVVGASLFCVVILAIGKAYISHQPKFFVYIRTVFYYIAVAAMASGATFIIGDQVKKLVEKFGWFGPSLAANISVFKASSTNPASSSY